MVPAFKYQDEENICWTPIQQYEDHDELALWTTLWVQSYYRIINKIGSRARYMITHDDNQVFLSDTKNVRSRMAMIELSWSLP